MKLRVTHFPQVGSLRKGFSVEVSTPIEAFIVAETMAFQHLWLEENNVIPDFSNVIIVSQWNEDEQEWEDFWDDEEMMEWDEYVREILKQEASCINGTLKFIGQ
jgi:hypothetical protein